MVTPKDKRKRSKAMLAMILPALIFIAIIGWCMYWVGSQKKPDKKQRKQLKKDNVTVMPILKEESQEIEN